jgi:hypothetical protein
MESNVSSAGSVITAAVAGNERTRRLRACIAQATCPNLDNRFARAGAEGPGVPPPLEMTGAKEEVVLATGQDPDKQKAIEKFVTSSKDTVLIIGQVCFKFFNKQCEPLLSGINESSVYIMGGTTPFDFNISKEGIDMLNGNNCKIYPVPTSECPKYKFVQQWAPLISKYDKVAQDVHNIAVAAFLTSRTATMDGAFYRQFGLADMAQKRDGGNGGAIITFESVLANEVKLSDKFSQEIKGKMDDIISHCAKHQNPPYGEGKAGGMEEVYQKLYSMWNSALNADTHPDLMAPLSSLILKALQIVGSPGANEYDGYTTAKMLYQLAGAPSLTSEQHYKDLMSLFNTGLCAPAWVTGLSKILRKGNLYVYHDAGLDPYVDDYIALKILNAAHGELGMYHALHNPRRRRAYGGGRRRKRRKKTKKKKKRKSKKGARRKKRKTKKNRRKTKKRRR